MRSLARLAAMLMLAGSLAFVVAIVVDHIDTMRALRRFGVHQSSWGIALLLLFPGAFVGVAGYALVKRHDWAAILSAAFALVVAAFLWTVQQAARGG